MALFLSRASSQTFWLCFLTIRHRRAAARNSNVFFFSDLVPPPPPQNCSCGPSRDPLNDRRVACSFRLWLAAWTKITWIIFNVNKYSIPWRPLASSATPPPQLRFLRGPKRGTDPESHRVGGTTILLRDSPVHCYGAWWKNLRIVEKLVSFIRHRRWFFP